MEITEEQILDMLRKSEKKVYEYIKKEALKSKDRSIRESMTKIGEKLDVSGVTVHRAIRILRNQGIVGIVPSKEKAESNEIVYYGIPDPEKQVNEIFRMIEELNASSSHFDTILKLKQQQINKLEEEKKQLNNKIDDLTQELEKVRKEKLGIDPSRIITSQPLEDGTTAYIIKN